MKDSLRAIVLTLVGILFAGSARADWAVDGNPISTADDLQMNPVITSDGASGALIAWQDRRNGSDFDIYVQKVDASGNELWTPGGVAVCTEAGDQTDPRIVDDSNGGIILVWEDARSTTNFDIYVQRVDVDGNPLWTTNGVAVCALLFNQHNPTIAPDAAGGAIVVWQDHRTGSTPDIFAQRVDADGNALWTPDGIEICTAARAQSTPIAVADGAGGAIACWVDKRAGLGDIYAQRMNADSTIAWAANGVALCTDPEDQAAPAITGDQAGGAFIAWADKRSGTSDIYANYIDPTGTTLAANGMGICTAADDQSNPSIAFVSFEVNRAVSSSVCALGTSFIAWDDKRTDAGDIYTRDFDCVGNSTLPVDGLALCTAPLAQIKPAIANAPFDFPVVAWQDQRANFHTDIYAQQVSVSGVDWEANGVKVCGAAGSQYDPVIAFAAPGSPIVVWEDLRSGTYDVYAQFVTGAPNAVAITSFDAVSDAGAVTLRAAFRSDLTIDGVRVYRGDANGTLRRIADADASANGFEFVDRDVAPGAAYRYQIGVVDADGEIFSPIVAVSVAAVVQELDQNRPNPFNPSTTIRFVVPVRERVSLVVYDASGRKIRTLVDEPGVQGAHEAIWDGRDDRGIAQSSGVYFYRLHVGKQTDSKKMLLLK